ncbi:MAG: PilZ domain-containing protein [Candidatus Omnitrophota bacterium]
MQERRSDFRAGVSFPVECSKLPARSYFYTVSRDLSATGVRIVSNDFLACGETFKLNINLIDAIVDIKAKVVWCAKESVADRYSAGLQFVEVSESSKGALTRLLSKMYNA